MALCNLLFICYFVFKQFNCLLLLLQRRLSMKTIDEKIENCKPSIYEKEDVTYISNTFNNFFDAVKCGQLGKELSGLEFFVKKYLNSKTNKPFYKVIFTVNN